MKYAASSEFARLSRGEPQVELVRVLWEIASDAYPQLPFADLHNRLERVARRARQCIVDAENDAFGSEVRAAGLAALLAYLRDEEGYSGNIEDYYDPRNSYLHEVLQHRVGIPITLSIIVIEVGRRAGLPIYGVPAPGHFVVGCEAEGESLYADPFCGVGPLTRNECRRQIEEITGETHWPDALFRPATTLEIVVRVLRNLKSAYARRDDWEHVLPVQQRLTSLLPRQASEERDLGLVLLRTGRPWEAAARLETYLATEPDDSEAIAPFFQTARRLGAEMN